MSTKNKCNGCPINNRGQYLKNMVCKTSCPRTNYPAPYVAELIDLQEKTIERKDQTIAAQLRQLNEVSVKVGKLEKEAKEVEAKSLECLANTIKLAELFKEKFGIDIDLPAELQPYLKQRPPVKSLNIKGEEFKIEPIINFTKIDASQSKLQ